MFFLPLLHLSPFSVPPPSHTGKTWAITVIPHPLPTFPISSHSYSERVRRKFRRNFTPDDTLFLLQPSRSHSRCSFSLSIPKFRTSTANGYYHSHSKFIVQQVIIMPSFVQYQTTDIMTKSFLMVEMEGRDSQETATSAKQRHKMRERKEDTKFIPLSAGIRYDRRDGGSIMNSLRVFLLSPILFHFHFPATPENFDRSDVRNRLSK